MSTPPTYPSRGMLPAAAFFAFAFDSSKPNGDGLFPFYSTSQSYLMFCLSLLISGVVAYNRLRNAMVALSRDQPNDRLGDVLSRPRINLLNHGPGNV